MSAIEATPSVPAPATESTEAALASTEAGGTSVRRPPPYATDEETLRAETTVEFMRAGGPGGQHVNKRETAVRLRHQPSGIVVSANERRSQLMNLDIAFQRLAVRLQQLNTVPEVRKATKVPAAVKRQRLADKAHRAAVKRAREEGRGRGSAED